MFQFVDIHQEVSWFFLIFHNKFLLLKYPFIDTDFLLRNNMKIFSLFFVSKAAASSFSEIKLDEQRKSGSLKNDGDSDSGEGGDTKDDEEAMSSRLTESKSKISSKTKKKLFFEF